MQIVTEDIRYKVRKGPDSLYRCPNCRSKHYYTEIEFEKLLDVRAPREVKCTKCGTRIPWLENRDYGITAQAWRMRQQRDRKHPPWEEKTPLWAIPRDED